ncbi:uncharacterized protein LOC144632797 isoform X2 [Oculina patagonica]
MDGNNQALRFTIEIFNAQFVTAGRYFLILRIVGSKVNRSKLKLFVGNSKVPLEDHEFTTDACLEDGDPETLATFTDSVISFLMPPESADGDIQLVVEAFRLPENPMHEGDKYGEAVFDVFPRRGALFSAVRQATPSSKDSNELYQFETNITLSQVQEGEGFWTSCGAVRAAVKLIYEEPEQTTVKQEVKQLGNETLSCKTSLMRKQINAGSLANLVSSSEFEVSETRGVSLKIESDHIKKEETLKDDKVRLVDAKGDIPICDFKRDLDQQYDDKVETDESASESLLLTQHAAGSLANFCPSQESAEVRNETVDVSELDKIKEKGRISQHKINVGKCSDSCLVEKQEKAGSLANLCISSYMCSEFSAEVKDKEKREKVDEDIVESGEVISVWQNINQSTRDSPDDIQQQAGNIVLNSSHRQLRRAEIDREEHSEDKILITAEEGRVVRKRKQKGERVQPKAYHIDRSPVCLVTENYQSVTEPELQQIGYGTAEDSSVFAGKRERDEMRVTRGNHSTDTWKQREPVKKPQQLPVPRDPVPGPSTAPDTPLGIKTIQESALGSHVNSIPVRHLCGSYTAREGYCEAVVLAHGALGLPFKSDGRPPKPYIVGKSGKAEAQMQMGQSVTHAAIQPTHSPSWEELLLIEVKEEESKDEVVILLVADHPSKELLTEYTVPLGHLKPFHQYHLELVQPNSELSGDIRLYITLMKKLDKLPLPSVGSKMYGLEVLLRGLDSPVSSQMGPLIATGRIVTAWKEYKETMLSAQPRPTGVTVTTIHFPSPHPTSFAVAAVTHVYGAPQVTTAGDPQEQPQWNQTMFFLGDESSLFTATSALVVEYYPASLAMTRDCWQLTSPVGYSYQTMDQLLLSSLQWDSGRLGLRVDNLPIEGSNLRTAIGTGPTVGMVLRLVTNERPDQLLSAAHLSSLPVFRAAPEASQLGQSLPAQKSETAEQPPYGLPPMNAVKTILPQFHSLYNAPSQEPVKEYVPLANVSSPTDRGNVDAAGTSQIPPEIRGKLDIRSLAVMDYQMKEVDRYRTAMRKMATDLLHVREDCKRLEEANSRLRRELGQHDEISRLMVSSKDLDNVTHSELVQKFVLLKKKLADESSKKQELQTRLQRLQNDLIKKNEMEKEFLKLQEAHEGQQALLQKLQGKIQKTKTIQDTCKKQEKVIVQLEQLLAKQGKGQYNGETSETYRTLSEENMKLQAEVMQYKELLRTSEAKQKKPRSPGQPAASNGPMSDMERLELFEKLEKAEGRILALEKQLADNVRKWAKDKAELQMKLNESVVAQKTGYKNSSTSIDILDWHIGPKPTSPSRSLGPRRPSPKLDPLERR